MTTPKKALYRAAFTTFSPRLNTTRISHFESKITAILWGWVHRLKAIRQLMWGTITIQKIYFDETVGA